MSHPPVQFQFRAPGDLIAAVDEWRRNEPDIPTRVEALRRLIALGLSVKAKGRAKPDE